MKPPIPEPNTDDQFDDADEPSDTQRIWPLQRPNQFTTKFIPTYEWWNDPSTDINTSHPVPPQPPPTPAPQPSQPAKHRTPLKQTGVLSRARDGLSDARTQQKMLVLTKNY
ncbi:hypothetical protein HDV00_000447 [Rhizophlyctis rosea]|nr:hypothetical protein HDV00_000447 [Rhizophlyctis rosea]